MTGLHQRVIQPYDSPLHVVTSRRGWATLKRRHPGLVDGPFPDSQGWTRYATFTPKGKGPTEPHFVVVIDPDKQRDTFDLIDTCAHEAAHVAHGLMDHIGHTIGGTNDEPAAYLIGYLTRCLYHDATAGGLAP